LRWGSSGGVVDTGAPFSGREGRHVEDLELHPVGVVEEDCVVAGDVGVLLRLALEQRAVGPQPVGTFVHDRARRRLDREMVQADAIPVDVAIAALRFAQADRAACALQVPDRLAALALDLADAVPAERTEQLAVERQAAVDRRDDEVDVMDPHSIQRAFDTLRTSPPYHARACTCSTTTW